MIRGLWSISQAAGKTMKINLKLFKKNNTAATNGLRQPAGQRPRSPLRRDDAPATGYGQNRTFSYHAVRSQAEVNIGRELPQNKPLRRLPTRLQRIRKHSLWLTVTVLVLLAIGYQLQLSTTPRVISLATSSDAPSLQDVTVYQKAAHELFGDSAANRNKLTVNASDIASRLQQRYPELQEVSLAVPLVGSTPTLYVKPAEPALVLAATNGTFIVGENGRALSQVGSGAAVGRMQIPSVTDHSGLAVKAGQQVLPRSATAFISTVNDQLKLHNISVQSMTLPAAAGELDVYPTGKSYFVKFNLEQGSEDSVLIQVGTLLAVLKKQQSAPTQYVDVRLEGRAYYK